MKLEICSLIQAAVKRCSYAGKHVELGELAVCYEFSILKSINCLNFLLFVLCFVSEPNRNATERSVWSSFVFASSPIPFGNTHTHTRKNIENMREKWFRVLFLEQWIIIEFFLFFCMPTNILVNDTNFQIVFFFFFSSANRTFLFEGLWTCYALRITMSICYSAIMVFNSSSSLLSLARVWNVFSFFFFSFFLNIIRTFQWNATIHIVLSARQ